MARQYSENSWSRMNPVFDINSNIQNTGGQEAGLSLGGVIRNPYLYEPSPINADNDILIGVNVNSHNANVQIIGDYYDLNGGTTKGLFIMGDWRTPSKNRGAQAIRNDEAKNLYVYGIRVLGRTDSNWNGNIANNGPLGRSLKCIADRVTGPARGCLTNAQWIARGGR
jgi:hypothetical protein